MGSAAAIDSPADFPIETEPFSRHQTPFHAHRPGADVLPFASIDVILAAGRRQSTVPINMKRIDKLAIALVIAWILQAVLTSLIPLSHLFQLAERVALGVVCGGWLYGEAKRERETAWLWCLVGFFGSLSALILFYVYMMWQQSQNPRPAANNSPETNALGGP